LAEGRSLLHFLARLWRVVRHGRKCLWLWKSVTCVAFYRFLFLFSHVCKQIEFQGVEFDP
jgi:hypothetical protein